MADTSNKTEQATPERRRRAREEGQFARSRDAGSLAATAGVLLTLVAMGGEMVDRVRDLTARCLGEPFDLARADGAAIAARAASTFALLAGPPALAAAVLGAAVGFAEAGFHPRLELAMPKLDRLDPLARLRSLVAPRQAAVETALAVARVSVVAWIAWITLRDAFPTLSALARVGIDAAASASVAIGARLVLRACLALGVLSGLDYLASRIRLEKQLMMSKQDIKEEHRRQEGDPRIKLRLRARARERLRRALVKQVKSADVVLANPTHVSAALRYRPEEGAPILVAKGYDEVALHIREIAKEHGVTIVESPPLAREIARRVRVGRAIPVDLYAAVAQILAFVYRLRGRMPGARDAARD